MIWWSAVSSFTHVTVVPFGTVILAGLNAKFWILIVIAPGTCVCVVAGDVDGPELVHPQTAIHGTRRTIRITQRTEFELHLIQITPISTLAGKA
jgi:hypothetical protein